MTNFFKVSLLLLLFSANAVADCGGHSCTDVSISRLIVEADGDAVISTSGNESKLDCDAGRNGYIRLSAESKNYQATYALLLSAHTLESPLWIRTNDGADSCQLVYVVSDK